MLELLTVDYTAPDAGRLFAESLHHTGFAVIKNHPVAAQLVDAVYAEWQAFFATDSKLDYLYDKKVQEGYFPFESENAKYTDVKDLKEFYHYYPWGRLPQGMSGKTVELFGAMNRLAASVLDWLQINTPNDIRQGFSLPLSEMIKDSNRTLIRLIHYPALTGNEAIGSVRAAPHEDIGLLTLLPAATAKGLQVQDSQGNWHEVPCDYGTIVVNAGDTLTAITQGYYRATTHQVVNPSGDAAKKPRLSMPLFLHPRDEVLLPDGRQAVDYLMQRLSEIGVA
jgi:isopenicillin N synthase-like dioxygenase